MGRHDLSCLLCCCKAFLGDPRDDSVYVNPTVYSEGTGNATGKTPSGRPWDKVRLRRKKVKKTELYAVLGVSRSADTEEIRSAYKSRCIEMHPDKFAQRGMRMTNVEREQFQRIKEAYEVLADPARRQMYDVIGEKGMRWMEDPFSLDPKDLVENFVASHFFDRFKIFILVLIVVAIVLAPPILLCLRAENKINYSWALILTPLWIINAIAIAYHAKSLAVSSNVDGEEASRDGFDWVDPKVPIVVRVIAALKHGLLLLFQILLVLRLDDEIGLRWSKVFVPLFIWEALFLYKKLPPSRTKIVTKADLERAFGKSYAEFTAQEKEVISRRYIVVASTESVDFIVACRTKAKAKTEVYKSFFRIIFFIVLINELDRHIDWNWWLVFTPFWIASVFLCCLYGEHFIVVQSTAADMMGPDFHPDWNKVNGDAPNVEDGLKTERKPLSENEKEVVMNEITQIGYRTFSFCVSQVFLIIIVCILLFKLEGASFSSIWILSPILIIVGLILLCMGILMFGIKEIMVQPEDADEEGVPFSELDADPQKPGYVPPLNTADSSLRPERVLPSKSVAAGLKEMEEEISMIWGNMSLRDAASPETPSQAVEITAGGSDADAVDVTTHTSPTGRAYSPVGGYGDLD